HTPASWHWSPALQTTGSRPVQTPAWQVSLRVHAFPSSQAAPSGFVRPEETPVGGSHTPASSPSSPALQTTRSRPAQTPASHGYLRVQAFPSSHAAPSDFVGLEQTPDAGSHTPASWHWSPALQTTGSRPVQTPAWQVSLRVHAFPSSQAAPSGFVGLEQTPDAGSHTPAAWPRPPPLQPPRSRPVQTPAWQLSLRVHASPPSHPAPPTRRAPEQTPDAGSHTPASWHWSPALQTTGSRPMQTPAWQVSLRVHAFPSSHVPPSGFLGLEQTPDAGSHTPPSWHWPPALQKTGHRPLPPP